MNSAKPSRNEPEAERPEDRGTTKTDPRRRVWAAEAIGLVIVTLLILVYALVRYGRSIPWNAR